MVVFAWSRGVGRLGGGGARWCFVYLSLLEVQEAIYLNGTDWMG